ncbi:MAG: AMP-binding protein [Gemmatimonadetes bacterium]|nr:AMP-binding protein [Gemmatimonadota bacterium]
MTSRAPDLPIVERAAAHADRTAIVARDGRFTYRELLAASHAVATALLEGKNDLGEARVAYLVPPSFHWVATQWGIWRAGGVAVPLAVSHPPPELEYAIVDSGALAVVAHPELAERVEPIARRHGTRLLVWPAAPDHAAGTLPSVATERRAQIFYTSGTTGKPKGAVLTHANLAAQVQSLVAAWEWSAEDCVLGVLPLHHVHGVVNVLTCALWSGATCELMPRFDAGEAWRRLMAGGVTLFMAVPTIYARLIAAWERAAPEDQARMSDACGGLRLMVSGSAALPVGVLDRWRDISGHTLLERYGMTEIGMALSNPVRGPRTAGHVGTPLPGVEVRLVDDGGREVAPGTPGEIEVRGPMVFREYLGQPEATRQAFHDGWFRTGDMAVVEPGGYRVLGRKSVDIIKTGGYKVSALEIEEVLREHPDVQECAVVGVDDPEWGERVCVALVPRAGCRIETDRIQQWSRERLAAYKVPSRFLIVNELPRNPLGKVLKPNLVARFRETGSGKRGNMM